MDHLGFLPTKSYNSYTAIQKQHSTLAAADATLFFEPCTSSTENFQRWELCFTLFLETHHEVFEPCQAASLSSDPDFGTGLFVNLSRVATWPARSSSDLQWMLLGHIVLWDKLMPCRIMLCESRHARVHQMNGFYFSSRIGGVAGLWFGAARGPSWCWKGKSPVMTMNFQLDCIYIYSIWTIWRFQKLGYPQISSIWFSDHKTNHAACYWGTPPIVGTLLL